MLAIHDERQALHRPLTRIAGGVLKPNLEVPERIALLREGLALAGIDVVAPAGDDEGLIRALHDVGYLDFLENGFAAWRAIPGNGPELRSSIHPNIYMNRRPDDLLGRAGFYQADAGCVLVEGTWQAARASALTALDAAARVLEGEGMIYALCRPPGHHAYRDKAGGFCYLNNSALAAERAVLAGRRVAILDIDVHHGNGTQTMFYDRGDVLTLSVHGDPAYLYPYYAGYADEAGTGAGVGRNRNFLLPLGSDGAAYRVAVRAACDEVRRFGADFLVLALGLDASVNDPFACMTVNDEDFARIAEDIADLRIPTVIVQEGGYVSPFLAGTLAAFLSGISR
ncbi:histone deacetylase family protein [Shinella yambaruensis]|uniref:Acetylpolyamine amidohydrolase n=1 Tax=Shinella yambaruensis TaxID=415996 RepID=A0ABQ5ZHK0_9HYPH|nr:histone deacetylase family protein [Shinella yambaruensis]MCJ8024801.1 histone deacetylase family protein [Shinella yambaruensis]MCU7979254.1 histone deacetylase family protein [Shinella yambaruensis]GLR51080.1 acetylpolyamine amidohydrolase [Shinella yambaruensis]